MGAKRSASDELHRLKPTKRFSGRALDYTKGRPGYPRQIVNFLKENAKFSSDWIIADIGSGTGKLTELFLKNGNMVYGVEPNQDMRKEAERLFRGYSNFKSIDGKAEETGLPEKSVDLVTCGQAFHWFETFRAKKEFSRILKTPGNVLLVWNTRGSRKGTFNWEYEHLIEKHQSKSRGWTSKRQVSEISKFFADDRMERRKIPNNQTLDLKELLSRVRSASYIPKERKEMLGIESEAKRVFAKYAVRGRVTMNYTTALYFGRIL